VINAVGDYLADGMDWLEKKLADELDMKDIAEVCL
jgi:hypothetical protein